MVVTFWNSVAIWFYIIKVEFGSRVRNNNFEQNIKHPDNILLSEEKDEIDKKKKTWIQMTR